MLDDMQSKNAIRGDYHQQIEVADSPDELVKFIE